MGSRKKSLSLGGPPLSYAEPPSRPRSRTDRPTAQRGKKTIDEADIKKRYFEGLRMREAYYARHTTIALAREYGVGEHTIRRIVGTK